MSSQVRNIFPWTARWTVDGPARFGPEPFVVFALARWALVDGALSSGCVAAPIVTLAVIVSSAFSPSDALSVALAARSQNAPNGAHCP